MNEPFDVAIVGYGPSGAIAAGLLAKRGLSVFICDRAKEVYSLPRAFAIDHEILRIFQQIGVVEKVLPWTDPFTPSEYFGVDGQLIKRLTTVEPPYPQGYVPSVVFNQPEAERALRAHLASVDNIDVALGLELVGLTQDADGVTLALKSDDGVQRDVRARYVIGCDGASSKVRALVGIELEDLGFDEPWMVVDVKVNEQGAAKLPKTSVQYCEPERPCTFLIGTGNHRRWELSLNAGEVPAEISSEENVWKLLSRWITPDDATLWRRATYRFHALVAKDWRAGRVFIAGDAAHQQPPFLGQGMCQGARDVSNLAWKLHAVLKLGAADSLLDTYGGERGLHVRQLTAKIKDIGAVICERDVVKAHARDAHLLEACGGVVQSMPRQNILPRLETGVLASTESPSVGTLFPQPWIIRGNERVRLDELAGCGWRLVLDASVSAVEVLLLEEATHPLALSVIAMGTLSGGLQEADSVLANWFSGAGAVAALVRPDHYVYGVAKTAVDVSALIESAAKKLMHALAR